MKTRYPGGKASDADADRQCGAVMGNPISEKKRLSGAFKTWKEDIYEQVEKQINDGDIKPVSCDDECNLYVTFYIAQRSTKYPDIDNLLTPFLEQIKKARFIRGHIRGIKAEKEIVQPDEWRGVKFWYLITKTFYIHSVKRIHKDLKNNLKNQYSSMWNNPMQKICAQEYANGKRGALCTFIDNIPGNVFISEDTDITDKEMLDIIPGYNWQQYGGRRKIYDGCLVFRKKPSSPPEKGEIKEHWWLNKW